MSQFIEYSSLFLEFKQHELKPSTFSKYTRIVLDRLNPYFGEMPVSDIKPSTIKKWLYSIEDVGNKSKRIYLGVLSGVFKEALEDEVITRNPVSLVRLPKIIKPRIVPFNADEVKLIMDDAVNTNYRLFLAFAFYTGMRSGEIIALKKSDIDLENMIIKVSRSRSHHGESSPKTRLSTRDIPILDLLKPYVLELLSLHDHEYLFITQYKQPYIDTHVFVHKHWRPSLKRLGIEYRRPYNARHTFATNMLYRNLVTPVQLSQILGHANTQMVFDVYVAYLNISFESFDRSISIYS